MTDFVCCTVLKFADGTMEAMMLHRGDKEACENVADLLPSVAYNGERRVVDSRIVVMPGADWDNLP